MVVDTEGGREKDGTVFPGTSSGHLEGVSTEVRNPRRDVVLSHDL